MRKIFIYLFIASFINPAMSQATFYVNAASNNSVKDGSDWDYAFTSLDDALEATLGGDQIWVAKGTYYPTCAANDQSDYDPTNRNNAFVLKKDVKIYGGFEGTESYILQRNWGKNKTILSGNINANGDQLDNCGHVVISVGDVGNACLDGFTISNGMASEEGYPLLDITIDGVLVSNNKGAGIYCSKSSPKLSNLTFDLNLADDGANMYFYESSSIISNIIINNTLSQTTSRGFGIYIGNSDVTVVNTLINSGGAQYGGAVFVMSATPTFINCTFVGNNADSGGGIYVGSSSQIKVYNSIIANNTASDGNDIFSESAGNIYKNNLVYDQNTSVENIQASDQNIFSTDPKLSVDYKLTQSSPAINKGLNSFYNNALYGETDLDQNARIQAGTIDMGAFEFEEFSITLMTTDTVCRTDDNIDLEIEITGGEAPYSVKYEALTGNDIYSGMWTDLVQGVNHVTIGQNVNYAEVTLIYVKDKNGQEAAAKGKTKVRFAPVAQPNAQGVLFVNNNSLLSGDGSSWDNAIKELADALKYTRMCGAGLVKEIWVAQGIYIPMYKLSDSVSNQLAQSPMMFEATDRDKTFALPPNVGIYGGFNSTEVNRNERNWTDNITELNGDINYPGDASDNVYHVVVSKSENNSRLDGFTISEGMADGMYAGIMDGDTIVLQSQGGGIYDYSKNKNKHSVFANLIITYNTANQGGGIFTGSAKTEFANSLINYNSSINPTYGGGGGILSDGSYPVYTNLTITDNYGVKGSELAMIAGANDSMINCIIWSNGTFGPHDPIYLNSSYPKVESSLYNRGIFDDLGCTTCLTVDPQFDADYTLLNTSPAVDAGNTGFYNTALFESYDLKHDLRVYNNIIDIGAYEYKCPSSPSVKFLTTDTTLCKGASINVRYAIDLASPPPYSITYEKTANGLVVTGTWTDSGLGQQTITPDVTTVFKITAIKDGNGCKTNITEDNIVTVTVNECLKNDVATVFACDTVFIDIKANDVVQPGAVITVTKQGEYGTATVENDKIKYINTGGLLDCLETADKTDTLIYNIDGGTAQVLVKIVPLPDIVPADSCSFFPKLLINPQYVGAVYVWEYSVNGTTPWVVITGNTPTIHVTKAGFYRIRITFEDKILKLKVGREIKFYTVNMPNGVWYNMSTLPTNIVW